MKDTGAVGWLMIAAALIGLAASALMAINGCGHACAIIDLADHACAVVEYIDGDGKRQTMKLTRAGVMAMARDAGRE